jgi:hypothetical protein
MSVTRYNSTTTYNATPATSLGTSIPLQVVQGNLVIIVIGNSSATFVALNSIVDNIGNTYNFLVNQFSSAGGFSLFMYYGVASVSGSATFTATFNSTVADIGIIVSQYAGAIVGIDTSNSFSGGGTSFGVTLNASNSNDLTFAVFGIPIGSAQAMSTSPPMTQWNSIPATPQYMVQDGMGSGTLSAQATVGTFSYFLALGVAFIISTYGVVPVADTDYVWGGGDSW